MHEEVEIKVHLKNPTEVESFLNKNAKLLKKKEQVDVYFSPAKGDFFAQHPVTQYIRIRSEGKKKTLEYLFLHFDKDEQLLKTDEYETVIDGAETMSIILDKLGFKKRVTVTKKRTSFIYKGFEISLDHIKELGHFIEVEAKKVGTSAEQTRQACFAQLKELNADWSQTKNMGYPLMILDKKLHH